MLNSCTEHMEAVATPRHRPGAQGSALHRGVVGPPPLCNARSMLLMWRPDVPCLRSPQVRQYTTERALPLLQVDTRSKAWVFESGSTLSGGTSIEYCPDAPYPALA